MQGFGIPQVQNGNQAAQVAQGFAQAAPGAVLGYNCGATGHISKHCPLKPGPSADLIYLLFYCML